MKCPYCGTRNSQYARICVQCGERLDRVREKRHEKRIILYGVFLIAVILAAGLGAMFAVSKVLGTGSSSGSSHSNVTIETPTPTPEATPTPTPESEPEPEPTETPEPTPEEPAFSAGLTTPERQAQIPEMGYAPVVVVDSAASSTIYQEGVDNNAYVLFDGSDWSSWQEGVDGDGIGENVSAAFDREYQVRFLVLRLGNWYQDDYFYGSNGRPQTLTFELGPERFQITFPDEKRDFCIELSKDVPASSLRMVIDAVYSGYEFADTCISEVIVYGK